MTEAPERLPDYQFLDLRLEADPYGLFKRLRDASPVVKGGPGAWGVTRHADVSALLRDRRLSSDLPSDYTEVTFGNGVTQEFQDNLLINRDEPDHTRLRLLVGKAFRTSHMLKLRDHIADLVDELLAPALDGGTFDVVSGLAQPLPVRVICEVLGLPQADWQLITPHVLDLGSLEVPRMDDATVWFRDYIGDILGDRRPDEDGQLLERLLAAEEDGDRLTHAEVVDNALLLFVAGFATTSEVIGKGCAALLGNPKQFDLLAAGPRLAALAFEEFVRYDGPVSLVQRLTLEPIEVGGRTIRENRVVLLLIQSANRDERAFDRPDEVDVTRNPNPHVGFGGGIHHCLGNQLARTEGEMTFKRIAERFASMSPAGQAMRVRGTAGAFTTLPITVTAG